MDPLEFAAATRVRLARHRLAPPAPRGTPLAEIAAATAGVHGQVPTAAEHSLAMRVEAATRSDVQTALADGSLVRTFGPRGTVHLLPADDLPWWTAALGAVPSRSPFGEGVRLDAEQTDSVVGAIGSALAGVELTVDELGAAVGDLVGQWAVAEVMPAFGGQWARWRQVVPTAAHRGVLCLGAGRGRRVTYRNPGVTPWPDTDAAVDRLVAAWLAAYGPAGPDALAPWLNAPTAWAARVLARRSPSPAVYDPPDDPGGSDASCVLLLPYFDSYVVGSRPRELLFPGAAARRALTPSGQAGNYPVLLVDGVVAGVWHGRRSGTRVDVTVEPLSGVRLVGARRSALDDAVTRLGEILEARPTLTLGRVSAGPHA